MSTDKNQRSFTRASANRRFLSSFLSVIGALFFSISALAQTAQTIYAEALQSGWQDWSWGTRDFNNSSPVHGGTKSIKAVLNTWEAVSFWHSAFDSGPDARVSFWANGGSGGQRLLIAGVAESIDTGSYLLMPLPPNAWTNIVVPLSAFGAANRTNFTRFHLQLHNSGTTAAFYLDDVQLLKPFPAVAQVNVNASSVVRAADARWFGVNTAIWDGNFDSIYTKNALAEMGCRALRFPGGSLSDEYHWATGKTGTNAWQWATSFGMFAKTATNASAQAFITVNYGSGTPEEAAGWVRHANITNRFGFKYWEIGNEIYGTWETDNNALRHHAYTYAVRAQTYMNLMRAVDPTIKIGVVVAAGEDSYQNGYIDHPALNPRTGQTKYGWTPVLLSTLKQLGAKPDFIVHHHYPQWTDPNNPAGGDDDEALLGSAGNWSRDAADLRQQITDYFGPNGTNIELVVTENNANAGAQGRQSTSLVDGLYYAESLGHLMQTEFNAFVWWDLRNGTDTQGDFGPNGYGWRTYGDLGMINGPDTKHPTFYAAKLMQYLAEPGAAVVSASTDFSQLSAYSARGANGLLSLLVINKDRNAAITGRVAVAGFVPKPTALVRSYGKFQDEAARTNGPSANQDLSTNTFTSAGAVFTNTFAPYSLTLFTFSSANAPPVANDESITTTEDTAKAITLTGSDVDGDVLVYTIATPPVHGILTGTAPMVTYIPATNYNGLDSFTFKVNDGVMESAIATISIVVEAPATVTVNLYWPVIGPGGVNINANGSPGLSWSVERATKAGGPWSSIGNLVVGVDGTGQFSDPNPPPGTAFYRAVRN